MGLPEADLQESELAFTGNLFSRETPGAEQEYPLAQAPVRVGSADRNTLERTPRY